MLTQISYYLIFGRPLIMYMGILVLLCFLTTATLGYLIHHGKAINFKWHKRMAAISIALALIHGFFGIMAYL